MLQYWNIVTLVEYKYLEKHASVRTRNIKYKLWYRNTFVSEKNRYSMVEFQIYNLIHGEISLHYTYKK